MDWGSLISSHLKYLITCRITLFLVFEIVFIFIYLLMEIMIILYVKWKSKSYYGY